MEVHDLGYFIELAQKLKKPEKDWESWAKVELEREERKLEERKQKDEERKQKDEERKQKDEERKQKDEERKQKDYEREMRLLDRRAQVETSGQTTPTEREVKPRYKFPSFNEKVDKLDTFLILYEKQVVFRLSVPPLPPPRDFMPLCFSEPPGSELPPKKSLPKSRSTTRFYNHFLYIRPKLGQISLKLIKT